MDRYTLEINTSTGKCTLSKNGAHMLVGKLNYVKKMLKPGGTVFLELEAADTYYRKEKK